MRDLWASLYRRCCRSLEEGRSLGRFPDWPEFRSRLDREFIRFAELLWRLYGSRPDFAYTLEEILYHLFTIFQERPRELREQDSHYDFESPWFLSENQVGAVAYVDRFAGTFQGIKCRIPFLQELGVTYLHLMPFFKCPEGENDGGYAVSSYRETDPGLGSMEDLAELARELAKAGIYLVADFIFNHTSKDHAWARKARSGDPEYQDYYWMFNDYDEVHPYQARLRDIFPEHRKGSFTFVEELRKWVWTTFHSFQWDLNYRNPSVFDAMVRELLFLANQGISVLRLDAVAFIWKEAGTTCENREEAHLLIQAFQCAVRLVAPSLVFKSEAIVHPDQIARYIDPRECALSYNPLLMAELWEAAATKDVRLLVHSLRKRHSLPPSCAWVNYVRCHDDIGWTFADEDAAELGIKGRDHRVFLNTFYMGEFPGSFSRGVGFQHNPHTGDRRICGTAASLAGVEQALQEGSGADLERALRRVLLLYGIIFSAGGLPLIYLGDEVCTMNHYEYLDDPAQAADSRWVHRPLWSDGAYEKRLDRKSLEGKIFTGIQKMSRERKAHAVFAEQELSLAESGHPSVLIFHKQREGRLLTVVGNFSETPVILDADRMGLLLAHSQGRDLLSGNIMLPLEALELESCGLRWILSDIAERSVL